MMRTLFKVARQYKLLQKLAQQMPNQQVEQEFNSFARSNIEKLFDAEVNSPNAPEGTIEAKVTTFVDKQSDAGVPAVRVAIEGNTPEVTRWAQAAFKKIQKTFIDGVTQITQKASAPFNVDFVVLRTY